MAAYESTFICSPEVPAEKLEELIDKVKKIIENSKGSIISMQQLGKKKMSYPIKKFREGSYIYMELSGPGEMVGALETFYKVNDPVIRYLTIKVEKKKKAATEKAQVTTEEVKTDESNKPQTSGAE